jgi:hypothetical protein
MVRASRQIITVDVSPQTAHFSAIALSALRDDVGKEIEAFSKRLERKLIQKHKLALSVTTHETDEDV